MHVLRETVAGGDRPEIEIFDGARVRKMSPKRRHATTQAAIASILRRWAPAGCTIGTEWRFHVSGEQTRKNPYVPDVAYVSRERLYALSPEEREEPPFAPDIAVEIFSPGERETILAKKIARYLTYGARLVLDVRPIDRTITAHDGAGARVYFLFDDVDPPEPA